MMTTNLFVIANVKQLRTGGSFRILLSFFRTSWGIGVLNSVILNSFHNQVEFGTILEGLQNFGGGGFNPPNPTLGTPLVISAVLNHHSCNLPSSSVNMTSTSQANGSFYKMKICIRLFTLTYWHINLYIDMFCILRVIPPFFGSTEHKIN